MFENKTSLPGSFHSGLYSGEGGPCYYHKVLSLLMRFCEIIVVLNGLNMGQRIPFFSTERPLFTSSNSSYVFHQKISYCVFLPI